MSNSVSVRNLEYDSQRSVEDVRTGLEVKVMFKPVSTAIVIPDYSYPILTPYPQPRIPKASANTISELWTPHPLLPTPQKGILKKHHPNAIMTNHLSPPIHPNA